MRPIRTPYSTGFAVLLLLLAAGLPALAATTEVWEMNAYNDFIRGKLTGLSLNRDGKLALAPKLEQVFAPDQPQLWSLARASDGSLYVGTGHRGRVYRIDPKGSAKILWTSDQPEVFALAVDAKGVVYAGTSPDGKIYKIDPSGKAVEYFAPGAKYIWALQFASDGVLYAGTGDTGKVFRITGQGKGEVFYESGQANITSLALDSEGHLLAGSEPNGILYRITAKGKAFALYDSTLPEIRTITARPDGTIYAVALGGSLNKRAGAAGAISALTSGTIVTAPGTSITVTDTQAGLDLKKPDSSKPVVSSTLNTGTAAVTQAYEVTGVEKSAIYKINPDQTVETVYSSKDENIFDLAAAGDALLFSTDGTGRIYRLNPDRKPTLIEQTNETEATRLIADGDSIYTATGSAGRVYRIGTTLAPDGEFEAPVHDAGTTSRWGRLSWRADVPAGTKLAFHTRTGNSSRPDNTWSDWSGPLTGQGGSALITSPNARYIQWKAEFTASNGTATPGLYSVTAAYLPQNTAPVVRSVSASAVAKAGAAASSSSSSSTSSAFSVTVTDSGEASTSAGTPSQVLSRGAGQQLQIQWQADDAENDKLMFSLYFRGEDEHEWKLLRAGMFETSYLLDGDVLADGRYFFRVVASDKPSNPAVYAREAEGVSPPVVIDNTPPVVRPGTPRREGAKLEIDVDVADQATALRRCEYSIDAASWLPLEASDGVTDSPRERYELRLDNLKPGEHLVVFRAYDSAGNAGLAKVIVR
ncbi:MAG TPA: hypothetical protein VGL53_05895 [Bryobacteraceae bacterium]